MNDTWNHVVLRFEQEKEMDLLTTEAWLTLVGSILGIVYFQKMAMNPTADEFAKTFSVKIE